MKIATRHCAAIVVLSIAAGAVVWPAWVGPNNSDPCRRPDVLTVTGLIPGSIPEGERRDRLSKGLIQWSEGSVKDPDHPRQPLMFRIVRGYDVLNLTERPLMVLAESVEPEQMAVELTEAPGGPLPIHVIRGTGSGQFQLIAYLYVFGNEPVKNPLVAQVRSALSEPRPVRTPLTIFLAAGNADLQTEAARRRLAVTWIIDAWRNYREVCVPL